MAVSSETNNSRVQTELQLINQQIDFSAAYLAVQYLFLHIKKSLVTIRDQTIDALFSILKSTHHDSQKQAFFLFKEAADALIYISMDITHPFSLHILSSLQELLVTTSGKKHRAVSEALGSLPLKITGPDIKIKYGTGCTLIDFNTCLAAHDIQDAKIFRWQGRTLIYPLNSGKMLCIKFSRTKDNVNSLIREAQWLVFLNINPLCRESDFFVPDPVCNENQYLFKLNPAPDFVLKNKAIHPDCIAIMFIADEDYFHYANEPCYFQDQKKIIKEVYRQNAWLLGRLTSMGIIHTAIIPLFHNRAQQARRQDHGLYVWEQGGRLDKWLESCRYPNFAKSGLRDFEHLTTLKNTKDLRHFIGEHLLGFILVLGSFFRNKAPEKKGLDENGTPLDLRNLFDKSLFIDVITEVVQQYYKGITGFLPENLSDFLSERLIDSLIDQMGVDRHMEEILRVQDQNNMSAKEFESFLLSRGYDESWVKTIPKAEKDIILNTGPHLGGFNQTISVPELIEFLFCLSSLCVADRFIMENGLKACRN